MEPITQRKLIQGVAACSNLVNRCKTCRYWVTIPPWTELGGCANVDMSVRIIRDVGGPLQTAFDFGCPFHEPSDQARAKETLEKASERALMQDSGPL